MRPSALIPVVFGLAAFVLSMLCIFAGSKKGFMEDYAIVTLNTSQIGENVFNTSDSDSSNPLTSLFSNITNSIESEINSDLSSFAKSLGLHDFYSAHLLDYCEGYYTPSAVPNSTVSSSEISKNITSCSNRTSFFHFNPTSTLQHELNTSGVDINLSDLDWPDAINDGISTLRIAQKAAFILYCIAAAFLAIATLFTLASVFLNGRLSALVDILLWTLAFLAILLASAITTAVGVKVANVVNKYGKEIGVEAVKGKGFLVLTWVATGLAFVNCVVWCGLCVVGRRRDRRGPRYMGEK